MVEELKKSSLDKIGCGLMLFGWISSGVLTVILKIIIDGGRLSLFERGLLIFSDVLKVLVFVGLAIGLIGLLRNRKYKKAMALKEANASKPPEIPKSSIE